MATKKRTIEFYWLNVAFDTILMTCNNIMRLPLSLPSDANSRYVLLSAVNKYLSVRVDGADNDKICASVCHTRFDNYPYVDMGEREIPLNLEEEAKGLLEKSYFVMIAFRRMNVVGTLLLIEKNKNAPNIYALSKYLKQKGQLDTLQVYRLVGNVLGEAYAANRCSMLEFEVVNMSEDCITNTQCARLSQMFRLLAENNVPKQRIMLNVGRERESISLDMLRGIVDGVRDYRECFSKASAKISTEVNLNTRLIDIYSNVFVREINVLTERGNNKYLDRDSMYCQLYDLFRCERRNIGQLQAIALPEVGELD